MLDKFCTVMWEQRPATTGLAIGSWLPLPLFAFFGIDMNPLTWAWIGLCTALCGISWASIWPLLYVGKEDR